MPTTPAPTPPGSRAPITRPPRLSAGTTAAVAVLLAIPLIALAAVPTYSKETPVLWGFPFFYWYQLLWVLITPILTYTAYKLIKRGRAPGREGGLERHPGDGR